MIHRKIKSGHLQLHRAFAGMVQLTPPVEEPMTLVRDIDDALSTTVERCQQALTQGQLRKALQIWDVLRPMPGALQSAGAQNLERALVRRCRRGTLRSVRSVGTLRRLTPQRLRAFDLLDDNVSIYVSVAPEKDRAQLILRRPALCVVDRPRVSYPVPPRGAFALSASADIALVGFHKRRKDTGLIHVVNLVTGALQQVIAYPCTRESERDLVISSSGRSGLLLDGAGRPFFLDLARATSQPLEDATLPPCRKVCLLGIDGERALLCSARWESHLELWNLVERRRTAVLEGHHHPVLGVDATPDGVFAVTGGKDGMVALWKLSGSEGECKRLLRGHSSAVLDVAIDPTGRLVASVGADNTLRLWDAASGSCLETLVSQGARPLAVGISPDANLLVTATSERVLHVWRLEWSLDAAKPRHVMAEPEALRLLELFLATHPRRHGNPRASWSDNALDALVDFLSDSGWGWLEREGIRLELERLATPNTRP